MFLNDRIIFQGIDPSYARAVDGFVIYNTAEPVIGGTDEEVPYFMQVLLIL